MVQNRARYSSRIVMLYAMRVLDLVMGSRKLFGGNGLDVAGAASSELSWEPYPESVSPLSDFGTASVGVLVLPTSGKFPLPRCRGWLVVLLLGATVAVADEGESVGEPMARRARSISYDNGRGEIKGERGATMRRKQRHVVDL